MSDHLEFEQGKGMTAGEYGRPVFPQYLRIVLDRRAAWDMLYSLTQQLREEDQDFIQLYQYGELKKEDET